MLNGDLEQATRIQNLNEFRSHPGFQVLLATIRSAGVGINLRCAQKVYIMVSDKKEKFANYKSIVIMT